MPGYPIRKVLTVLALVEKNINFETPELFRVPSDKQIMNNLINILLAGKNKHAIEKKINEDLHGSIGSHEWANVCKHFIQHGEIFSKDSVTEVVAQKLLIPKLESLYQAFKKSVDAGVIPEINPQLLLQYLQHLHSNGRWEQTKVIHQYLYLANRTWQAQCQLKPGEPKKLANYLSQIVGGICLFEGLGLADAVKNSFLKKEKLDILATMNAEKNFSVFINTLVEECFQLEQFKQPYTDFVPDQQRYSSRWERGGFPSELKKAQDFWQNYRVCPYFISYLVGEDNVHHDELNIILPTMVARDVSPRSLVNPGKRKEKEGWGKKSNDEIGGNEPTVAEVIPLRKDYGKRKFPLRLTGEPFRSSKNLQRSSDTPREKSPEKSPEKQSDVITPLLDTKKKRRSSLSKGDSHLGLGPALRHLQLSPRNK